MEKYLIRVISRQGGALEQDVEFGTELEAIRYGKKAAAPGETLEVWREQELIFVSEYLGSKRRPRSTVLATFR